MLTMTDDGDGRVLASFKNGYFDDYLPTRI